MLDRLPEPQGDNAKLGEAYHAEMEGWIKQATLPTSKVGCALLRYSPAPGMAECEVPVWVQTPKSSWLGFIDAAYDIVIKREPTLVVEQVYQKELQYWEFGQPELMHERPIGPWRQNREWFSSGFEYAELGTTGVTVIHDWKTTGNIKNTKSADELREDPAVILYCLEAFQGGAQRVFCRWVYIQMSGTPTSREIWFEVTVDHVLEQLELMDDVAGEMQQLYQIRPKTTDLPMPKQPDVSCFAFGRQCHYFDLCQPPSAISMSLIGAPDMSEAFKSSMLATFPKAPALPGTVPALPSAPALPAIVPALPAAVPALPKAAPALQAPPLPVLSIPTSTPAEAATANALVAATHPHLQQFLAAEPTVESGSINSPEAPSAPSASPEQAIVNQAIPPAPGPIVDDLDGMTDQQIKDLGVAIGAFPQSSKMRRPGRIGAIRVKRLEGATMPSEAELQAAEQGKPAPALPTVPALPKAPMLPKVMGTSGVNANGDQVLSPVMAVRVPVAPAVPRTAVQAPAYATDTHPELEFTARDQASKLEGAVEAGEFLKSLEPTSGLGLLCINCVPASGTCMTLGDLLAVVQPAFQVATGCADYRLVKYGEGVGMMAVGLQEHLAAHYVSALVVDTRTQEGFNFAAGLQALAEETVRGF